jgi:hypothetical protein
MTYIDVETGEYPLFIGDLVLKTNLSAEEAMKILRYQPVQDVPLPQWDETQRMIELPPILENGVWRKNLSVRTETQEEHDARVKHAEEMAVLNQTKNTLSASGSEPNVVG